MEPPVVLDRAVARLDLAVPLGQAELPVAVLQVALAERRVLQVQARPQVQRARLLVQSQQWAPRLQAQESSA